MILIISINRFFPNETNISLLVDPQAMSEE